MLFGGFEGFLVGEQVLRFELQLRSEFNISLKPTLNLLLKTVHHLQLLRLQRLPNLLHLRLLIHLILISHITGYQILGTIHQPIINKMLITSRLCYTLGKKIILPSTLLTNEGVMNKSPFLG